jgi:hypothetical protein
MTDNIVPLDQQSLAVAADAVQKFVMDVAPSPGDGLGIAAMLLTNFLASGVACGILDNETVDMIMNSILDSVSETVTAIYNGAAAEAATETIQ